MIAERIMDMPINEILIHSFLFIATPAIIYILGKKGWNLIFGN